MAAGGVDHLEEVGHGLGLRGEPLPAHAAGQVDDPAIAPPLHDRRRRYAPARHAPARGVSARGAPARPGARPEQQVVERAAHLRGQRVQHAHRRHRHPALDLRDQAGRTPYPPGQFPDGQLPLGPDQAQPGPEPGAGIEVSRHDVNLHCTPSAARLDSHTAQAIGLWCTSRGADMPEPAVPALPLAPAPGRMNVDFEERVDFARLRQYRLERARAAMGAAGLGALLVFDNNNIRYLTGVAIGEWTRDKLCRYALYTRTGELVLWDFGSAAVHHRMYCPWLKPENCIASYTTMRGAAPPDAHLVRRGVAEIKDRLAAAGVAGQPVGVDFTELPVLFELQRRGITVRDGQQVMLDARQLKSADEIALLATAAAMVDGVYQDITDALKPGVRENEIVALANKRLYEMGSDDVESINAVSGERCNPHPHNFSDRMIRPGEQAFFDIMHSFNGYRTCYYRTFSVGSSTQAQRDAYAKATEWMEAAIAAIKPGVSTDQVARLWPTAQDIGLPDEKTAFGLQFGHGLGLALHERPIISRLSSLDAPMEIQKGMVFALETYCPASDGVSAARLEEEVVVVDGGIEIITRFPSKDLFVTNPY